MYDLSNTIFCPIGSALTKHPVASQIWTHNSNGNKKRVYFSLILIKKFKVIQVTYRHLSLSNIKLRSKTIIREKLSNPTSPIFTNFSPNLVCCTRREPLVFDAYTIIDPLADFPSVYMTCLRFPGHSIKLHLVSKIKLICT